MSTGQAFPYLMEEMVGAGKSKLLVSMFFFSYIILSVWVYFNLLIAIVMDYFQATFVIESLAINEDNVKNFLEEWREISCHPDHDTIPCSALLELIPRLDAPLNEIADGNNPFWYNRLLYEVGYTRADVDLSISEGKETTIEFHDAFMGLALIHQTYVALDSTKFVQANKEKHEQQLAMASFVIQTRTRAWLKQREGVPAEFNGKKLNTPARQRAYRTAVHVAWSLHVLLHVSRNRLSLAHREW